MHIGMLTKGERQRCPGTNTKRSKIVFSVIVIALAPQVTIVVLCAVSTSDFLLVPIDT